jgi:polyferredoxin
MWCAIAGAGPPGRGRIENVYRLQIMNATEVEQRFVISAQGLPGLEVLVEGEVVIASTQARWVAVRVQAPFDVASPGSHAIRFLVATHGPAGQVTEDSVFIVPR